MYFPIEQTVQVPMEVAAVTLEYLPISQAVHVALEEI
jgi:hypothetical protein